MASTPPFQPSLFESRLREYGVNAGDDIYKFYERMHNYAQNLPRSPTDSMKAVLATEADDEEADPLAVHPWRRRRNPIGTTTRSNVWLWEKEGTSDNEDRILQLVVKDAVLHEFWRDQPSEAILLRKLYDQGCRTVIRVHDWLYRGRSPHNEEGIIRILEEYAEHGDLDDVLEFYRDKKLILPEAFLWHIFWSAANTLCYCRHGTTDSPDTVDRWDPMFHMDVKPGNLLMAGPDFSVNQFYPSIKMSDFGGAYTLPETGYDNFRRWKSTWRFGTEPFEAPEVKILNPSEQGRFSPTSGQYGLHGSHTDIYSLGRTINWLILRNYLAWADEAGNVPELVGRYYSTDLRLLANACAKDRIRERPSAYELLQQTLKGTRKYQRIARKEQADAEDGWPFHSELLYTKESQMQFRTDPEFRMRYEQVNRVPLETGVKTVDPGEDDTSSPTGQREPSRQSKAPETAAGRNGSSDSTTLSSISDEALAALEADVNAQYEPRKPAPKRRAKATPAPKAKPARKPKGRPPGVSKQTSAPDTNGGPASRTRSRVPNAQAQTERAPAASRAGGKRKSDDGPAGGNKRVRFNNDDEDEDEDEPVAGPSKSAGKGSAKRKGKAQTSAKRTAKPSTKESTKTATKTATKSSAKTPAKKPTKTAPKSSAKTPAKKSTKTGAWKGRLRGD
ncbi:MAG: hypothetical protein Q9221_007475 [Calogaya cf. arnoldii]